MELLYYCLLFSTATAIVLLLYIGLIRWLQHGRPRLPGDSLLLVHSWPLLVRKILPGSIVLLLIIPLVLFSWAFFMSAILAPIEGWWYMDTFEYLLCNMVAIPPMVTNVPTTTIGVFVDASVIVINLIFTQLVIGFCAVMSWVQAVGRKVPETFMGCVIALFGTILVFVIVGFACSLVLALLDHMSVWDSILFTLSTMCGVGTPLTQVSPVTDSGNFFATLCSLVELGIGGAIIGILGGHPKMLQAEIALSGREEDVQDMSCSDDSSKKESRPAEECESNSYLREENERLASELNMLKDQLKVQTELERKIAQAEDSKIENRPVEECETNSYLRGENERLNLELKTLKDQLNLATSKIQTLTGQIESKDPLEREFSNLQQRNLQNLSKIASLQALVVEKDRQAKECQEALQTLLLQRSEQDSGL